MSAVDKHLVGHQFIPQEDTKRFWWSPSSQLRDFQMDPAGSEANSDEHERNTSTPHLPDINLRYDTPDSDYNYEVLKHESRSSGDDKHIQQITAVLREPPVDISTNYASSVVSQSDKSVDKESQVDDGSVKKTRAASNYSVSSKGSSKRKSKQCDSHSASSGSHIGSDISQSQKSYKECRRNGSLSESKSSTNSHSLDTNNKGNKSNQGKRSGSIRFEDEVVNDNISDVQNRRGSQNNVIRSCTYAEGFGPNRNGHKGFLVVDPNERPSKSAKELGLTFDRDFSSPVIRSSKSSARYSAKSPVAESEDYYALGSQYKLSLVDSASVTVRSSPDKTDRGDKHRSAWGAPRLSPESYNDIKERLLKEGKFKDRLRKYWGLDIQDQLKKADSDDDGYDTDLDTNLGLELIADEKSREVLEDGIYPEYKQNCRRFKSTPNSYFMRHSLDDNLRMRYRYLNKGDSIAVSTQMKNHLTMSDIDLKDNGIGPTSMNYFKHMLKENKRLTELNLSCNNLGHEGAKHLKNAIRSNCFLLKLNASKNNFGEKGCKHLARLIEENVNLKEINLSNNNIGDYGAMLISKALEGNISLKVIDLGWNQIGRTGGVKLCDCLKNNTELEAFRAETNGFGDEGGKSLINSLKINNVLKEVDLSNNRLTDAFIQLFRYNFNEIQGLAILKIARNNFQPKPIFNLLAAIMTAQTALTHIDIEGIQVSEEFKGLANAIKVVQDISVLYNDPPSKREVATDILTRNLVVLCEFLEDQEIEIEDLYPDYEELEENSDEIPMVTIGDVITQLEQTGKVTRPTSLRRLKANLKLNSKRKFHISELALVYDNVICGKDIYREKPLRSHLRRSIREERAEKERLANQKKERQGLFQTTKRVK